MSAEVKIDRTNLKPLPDGDSESAALFTRPWRFGKTTAMKKLEISCRRTVLAAVAMVLAVPAPGVTLTVDQIKMAAATTTPRLATTLRAIRA